MCFEPLLLSFAAAGWYGDGGGGGGGDACRCHSCGGWTCQVGHCGHCNK